MSFMDKIKAFFSGGSDDKDHAHEHEHEYLQSPSDPDAPVLEPTPEEVAAAMSAEPPTTTVEGLSEEESSPRDEVH
jgi:hypothetical protein